MREGDDPRDIYWRKSTSYQMVLRERARETRRDVEYTIDCTHAGQAPSEEWSARFERRIRDIASRAVAHLKRGDGVTIRTPHGHRTYANPAVGADPVLRFLALLEPLSQERAAELLRSHRPPAAPEPTLRKVAS
jgi:uncharacterized protein (DUF58 family)